MRYLSEGTPSLRDVATVTARLAEREYRTGRRTPTTLAAVRRRLWNVIGPIAAMPSFTGS